jgi:hypothetical protein
MLVTGADQIFETAATGDWTAVAATLATMNSAWGTYRSGGVPPLLETQMEDALSSLDDAVSAEDAEETRHASIEVGRASHDFRLRYRPATDIDQARFDLWLRQVAVDADADDGPGVLGDAATLEWTFDRFRHVLSSGLAAEIDSGLEDLRDAAESGNLEGAADLAADLRALLAGEAAR